MLGVALAIVISQAISAVLVTYCLMRRTPEAKLYLSKISVDVPLLRKMLSIGLPAALLGLGKYLLLLFTSDRAVAGRRRKLDGVIETGS